MKRVGSKNTMNPASGDVKKDTPNKAVDATKKKGGIDWQKKRESRLILAPQPRLTEFKSVYTANGVEANPEEQENIKDRIPETSLADLIPNIIQRHLIEHPTEVAQTPFITTTKAACLFLDISQFTTITETLSIESGIKGPELLAKSINKLFTQLVRLVQRSGGDIFKFAGDAVIVLWPATRQDESTPGGTFTMTKPGDDAEGDTLHMAAHRAVQCAWDVQKTVPELKLDEFKTVKNKKMDLSFAFKCGVGVGTVTIVHLGGGRLAFGGFASEYEEGRTDTKRVLDPNMPVSGSTGATIAGRREYIAFGEPLKQAFAAEKHAERHDIVVSRQCWSLIESQYMEKKVKSSRKMEDFHLIGEQKEGIRKKKQMESDFPSKDWMLTYVPRSAHLFLEVEDKNKKDWVSELRRVTVLFINLGVPKDKLRAMLANQGGPSAVEGEPKSVDEQPIRLLHEYFSRVQSTVMDYEGSINKFLMDDKGSTVIAVFGLPPISHENDATRGVLASLGISTILQEMGAEPSVGVATGIAFCGVVGHPGGRREYTVLGDIVNLAARLMQRATEKQEGVLCDRETYYQAQEHLEFNYLKDIKVKGKKDRVDVWQPHQKGFKTKRTLLGKALGVQKHRRRPSLDADWQKQVSQFSNRDTLVMSPAEVAEYKKLMIESRERRGKSRDAPAMSTTERSKSSVDAKQLGDDRHEDERMLKSDQFDDLMRLMDDIYTAGSGEPAHPVLLQGSIGTGKSRLLARVSNLLKVEKDIWVLGAACNPFERGTLARPFSIFVTLISLAIWSAHDEEQAKKANSTRNSTMSESATLDDVPVAFRRMILMRWLASAPAWSPNNEANHAKFLFNEDFGVDFEEPEDEIRRRQGMEDDDSVEPRDEDRNNRLIKQKAELMWFIFEGMCQDRRIVCVIDDALHMDSSSWSVALHLAKVSVNVGKGLSVVLSSRPISDFVLIDRNCHDNYHAFQKVPNVRKLTMPNLPPKFVRQLALEVLKVDAIGPEIEIALEKAQGNPLFVREMVQSMIDTPDVLDIDLKNKVATFGKAAQRALHNKDEFPSCELCGKRFVRLRDKANCRMCGRVLCSECSPPNLKKQVLGYKEQARCCIKCRSEEEQLVQLKNTVELMQLQPPVAIVCVVGTWIDKLSTKAQMVLKIACLLRKGLRFKKTEAFKAYPLDYAKASFENEFDSLVQLEFIRPVYEENTPQGIWAEDPDEYEFCHNFLPDVLNQRVLDSQREEMLNKVNEVDLKNQEEARKNFMEQKRDILAQLKLKEGYLYVHKTQVGSNRSPWKHRWAVIVGHRIEFYYDRTQKSCAAACDLRLAKVFAEKSELSGRSRVIKISVPNWEKRGRLVNDRRDFYVSPELSTDLEKNDWIYNLNMAIESNQFQVNRAKRGTSVTGWFKSKVPSKKLPTGTPATEFITSSESLSSAPRKSRGLDLILGRKKTSSSLGPDGKEVPALAAYQEEQ